AAPRHRRREARPDLPLSQARTRAGFRLGPRGRRPRGGRGAGLLRGPTHGAAQPGGARRAFRGGVAGAVPRRAGRVRRPPALGLRRLRRPRRADFPVLSARCLRRRRRARRGAAGPVGRQLGRGGGRPVPGLGGALLRGVAAAACRPGGR
ncbi:MAG: hypothetical protein AVDCRST_MAG08-144, partial [uncultured Acetobacteraceae bacterium]